MNFGFYKLQRISWLDEKRWVMGWEFILVTPGSVTTKTHDYICKIFQQGLVPVHCPATCKTQLRLRSAHTRSLTAWFTQRVPASLRFTCFLCHGLMAVLPLREAIAFLMWLVSNFFFFFAHFYFRDQVFCSLNSQTEGYRFYECV